MPVLRRETAPKAPHENETWMAAYAEQATPAVRAQWVSYARRCARLLARCGATTHPGYAAEMVDDALADTLTGTRLWDPARSKLKAFVFGVLRSRTSHELTRLREFPHRSIDALSESSATMGLVEEILATATRLPSPELRDLAARTMAALTALAARDEGVLAILAALQAGVLHRTDIAEACGMTLAAYDAARHRLDRLLDDLPQCLARQSTTSPQLVPRSGSTLDW